MLELEVKVLNMDLEKLEKKIKSLGGVLRAHERQTNFIIDNEARHIQEKLDSYLRIREKVNLLDGRETKTLTFKKNLKGETLRENMEINVGIDSQEEKENILKILSLLGYEIISIGYKDRLSYKLDNIRFDLDTWDEKTYPYPYMEIEVERKEDLDKALDLLEIPRENVSSKSIVELKKEINYK